MEKQEEKNTQTGFTFSGIFKSIKPIHVFIFVFIVFSYNLIDCLDSIEASIDREYSSIDDLNKTISDIYQIRR